MDDLSKDKAAQSLGRQGGRGGGRSLRQNAGQRLRRRPQLSGGDGRHVKVQLVLFSESFCNLPLISQLVDGGFDISRTRPIWIGAHVLLGVKELKKLLLAIAILSFQGAY